MTQAIVIETSFRDADEFLEGFRTQVDEEHLVLPASVVVPEGEWVQFQIALVDQIPILEGFGRCAGILDNGDEAQQSQRYDLMLDSLQFDGASQVVFDELLQARSAMAEQDLGLDNDAVQPVDEFGPDVEHIVDPSLEGVYLSRPPVRGSWRPEAVQEHESHPPSSGLFTYAGGLPFPAHPPRPASGSYYVVEPAARRVVAEVAAESEQFSDPTEDSDEGADA